jgi:hypothetical protein
LVDSINRRTLLAGTLAGAAASPALAQTVHEPAAPLTPPEDPTPRAVVHFAPERFDDIWWENDRIAHRIYGPALQAQEPPSGSGVDVWGKKTRWPFMQRQMASGSYHVDHGEGLDFYEVGGSRGCGGLGVWYADKLWTSRNFATYRILDTGGDAARFEVDYAAWPVDVVRKVSETRRVELPMGSNFNRITSTLTSDTAEPLTVGIGIARRRPATPANNIRRDRDKGRLDVWGPEAAPGSIGISVLVDPRHVAGFVDDFDNYLILVEVQPGVPFTYYVGACWDGGGDFSGRDDWWAHVEGQSFKF